MMNWICILVAWVLQLPCPSVSGNREDISPEALPVYQLWLPAQGRYFYTLDETEKNDLLARLLSDWTCDGIAFRACPTRSDKRLSPVYRFGCDLLNMHFLTIDEQEASSLIGYNWGVWTYEGIAFYAYPAGSQPAGTTAVHRFWSGSLGTHFYTADDRERFTLVSGYADTWQYEGIAYYAYPQQNSHGVQIIKGPAIQWITPESATILWETDVPADSHVCYGVGSVDPCDVWDRGFVTLHRVVLSGLAPDTGYVYTAASGSDSRDGSFITAGAPGQAFRFAVYSDSQWDPQVHRQIARNIQEAQPRLVFHAGDLVSVGRDLDVWQTEFFEPAAELLANIPVIALPGNHAYFGSEALWFYYYFDRPVMQSWFALTYDAVRFVGIDTSAPFAADSPQHEWLLHEFDSPAYRDATWHVIILHEPPFTATTGHGDNIAARDSLVPLFEQYGVDVVFGGHSHAYERYFHRGVCYIVTGGGGGPLYALLPDTTVPIRQFGLSTHHHCAVDVNPVAGSLTITAVDAAGQIFDLMKLRK
ncbi:MAG: metallophosphoesterase [Solirubrobacterales bacterium]